MLQRAADVARFLTAKEGLGFRVPYLMHFARVGGRHSGTRGLWHPSKVLKGGIKVGMVQDPYMRTLICDYLAFGAVSSLTPERFRAKMKPGGNLLLLYLWAHGALGAH